MQRQLSSFDIYVIISELQELKGSRIDKIYQLTRDELLIRVKNIGNKQKETIYIRNGELICLTQKQFDIPLKPTTFAMTLRKYLINGVVTEITQHEFDRIIKLNISRKEGAYALIIEFFSDGNIILVNPEGEILYPLIFQQWSHRKIKIKEPYIPPPAQINPFDITKEDFTTILKNSKADLVRTLAVNVNLSGPIAEEICLRAGIDKNSKINELSEQDIGIVFDALSEFLDVFKGGKIQPTLIKKDENVIDLLPLKFKSYDHFNSEKVESFTRALENFIGVKKPKKQKPSKIEEEIGKLQRQLTQQEETVDELKKKIDRKKIEGDLIYLNFQQCEQLLKDINKVLQQKEKEEGIKKINEEEMVKEFDPEGNLLTVRLKDTSDTSFELNIDFKKTVAENAEKAYDDNKKLRSKLGGAQESIKKTKSELEKMKKKEIEEQEKEKKITVTGKMFWFEKFRWFISSDGNIVIAGKDAKSNDLVVKKYLNEGSRYAHADVQGAPSCIIRNSDITDKNIPITEKTLEEACIFAASYSKAWKQFAEAQAYWVLPEQVSKTPQSGEFLPKGAFVIRGKRNYYRCKLELAIGKITVDDTIKIMGGPVDAVKKISDEYIVLVPGETEKSVISHKLSKAFNVSTDQIDRALPPGGVTVVETVGGINI